jgi:hypothetical protein
MDFVVRGRRGLAQPALKVRGREYLRIIDGPQYTEPGNLERLRRRSVGAKRSLERRRFAARRARCSCCGYTASSRRRKRYEPASTRRRRRRRDSERAVDAAP